MIDPTKPLTTQGGYAVRSVHQLSKPLNGYEWIGLCQFEGSVAWRPVLWTLNGSAQGRSDAYTLINEPQEIEVWVSVFSTDPHRKPVVVAYVDEIAAKHALVHCTTLDKQAIAFPVKIPLGYGVEQNDDEY